MDGVVAPNGRVVLILACERFQFAAELGQPGDFTAVFDYAVRAQIKGDILASGLIKDHDGAAPTKTVPHAQFIENVWVEIAKIRYHQVGARKVQDHVLGNGP